MKAKSQQMLPYVVQKGSQGGSLTFAQNPDLSAANEKVFGVKNKIYENRCSHHPGHPYEDGCPRQFITHPLFGDRVQRPQKAQTKEEKQKGCKS